MSQVRYDAHPSLLRTRPFAVLLTVALLLLGAAIAALGKEAIPAALPPDLIAGLARVDQRWIQLGGLAAAALAVLRLLTWWVATRSDRLCITDDQMLWTHGLLSKEYTEIHLDSVRTVKLSQSLFQRLVGSGDLTVYTTGDQPELLVRGLPQPDRVRELVRVRSGAGV